MVKYNAAIAPRETPERYGEYSTCSAYSRRPQSFMELRACAGKPMTNRHGSTGYSPRSRSAGSLSGAGERCHHPAPGLFTVWGRSNWCGLSN